MRRKYAAAVGLGLVLLLGPSARWTAAQSIPEAVSVAALTPEEVGPGYAPCCDAYDFGDLGDYAYHQARFSLRDAPAISVVVMDASTPASRAVANMIVAQLTYWWGGAPITRTTPAIGADTFRRTWRNAAIQVFGITATRYIDLIAWRQGPVMAVVVAVDAELSDSFGTNGNRNARNVSAETIATRQQAKLVAVFGDITPVPAEAADVAGAMYTGMHSGGGKVSFRSAECCPQVTDWLADGIVCKSRNDSVQRDTTLSTAIAIQDNTFSFINEVGGSITGLFRAGGQAQGTMRLVISDQDGREVCASDRLTWTATANG